MRARVVCNRYAPGYRSVSVRIPKNEFIEVRNYPANVGVNQSNKFQFESKLH